MTIIGGVGSSDIVQCFQKIIPVPDGVEFRNPDAYRRPVWQGDGREDRECGANPRGMEERQHGIMGHRRFRRPAGWLASIDYDEVAVQRS